MALSFSRQVPVFVLALLVAVYQVNKARYVATQWEQDTQSQMERVKRAIAQALPKQQLRFVDVDVGAAKRTSLGPSRALVISPAGGDHAPIVLGELYVDPSVKRDMQLQRQKSRYASRSVSSRKKGKYAAGSVSVLALLVEDEILLEVAKELERRRLVARIVQGKALSFVKERKAIKQEDSNHSSHNGQSELQASEGKTVNPNEHPNPNAAVDRPGKVPEPLEKLEQSSCSNNMASSDGASCVESGP